MCKQNKLMVLSAILISALISGCSSLNSKFDCPMHSGISCKSISEINDLVDKRVVADQNNNKKIDDILENSVLDREQPLVGFTSGSHTYYLSAKLGHKDNRMRAWMAPFEDIDGNFHEQNYVMLKIENKDRT